jgi:uncharacterized protein (DUF305 family)
MKRVPITLVLLLVAVVALTAFAGGVVVGDRDGPRPGMGMGMEWGVGMGMMGGRGMGSPVDVDSESEYLAEMTAHHQEAVEAAGELARSERPEMRAFGESIVRTQTAQIEQMTEWLAEWYPEQSLDVDYEPMMRDLSSLDGARLDRTFLQDMVGHHMMAVMMSMRLLAQGADHDQVADLAWTIRDEQHAEIIQMRRWLARWFGDTGGHMPGGMGMTMPMGMHLGRR